MDDGREDDEDAEQDHQDPGAAVEAAAAAVRNDGVGHLQDVGAAADGDNSVPGVGDRAASDGAHLGNGSQNRRLYDAEVQLADLQIAMGRLLQQVSLN